MNPLNWYRWLRAWRRIWWVHFLLWRARNSVAPFDSKLLTIVEATIRDHAPDTEVVYNNDGIHYCDGCESREAILVKTNVNQPLPHEFLCVGCWLDRLSKDLK